MAFGCVSFQVICTTLTVLSSVTTNAVATSPDPCMLHPCVHGACFSSGSIFFCQCPQGYTGTRCDKASTTPAPCSSNPCLHGSCANHGSSYTCSCASGYTGTNCDKALTVLSLVTTQAASPFVCLKGSSTIGAAECTTVETCGPHEVCFSDAYSTTTGIRREYGCRDSQLCASNQVGRRRSSSGGLLVCSQCCHGDMCNSKLCGEKGIPLNGGPTCFACDQFQDPDACNTIQHCGRDEICELLPDLSTVTHSNLYTSRCAKPQSCETQKNNVLMFSSGPVCGAKCCNTSLCNTESCSHSSPTTATPPIPTHAPANGCQSGNNWIDFGNSCYLIGARDLNWTDSQSYCNQNGGYLARIDTQAENDNIKAHLKSYPVQASYWIGLNKIRTNGVWTNTNTPATYTDWAPGQPQSGADDCVVAAHYFGWAWGDYGCHMSNTHQLCEIPKTPSGAVIG